MSKAKQYLAVALLAIVLLTSQIACDEDTSSGTGTGIGCISTACRDNCGGDMSCQIECCNGTRSSWSY